MDNIENWLHSRLGAAQIALQVVHKPAIWRGVQFRPILKMKKQSLKEVKLHLHNW